MGLKIVNYNFKNLRVYIKLFIDLVNISKIILNGQIFFILQVFVGVIVVGMGVGTRIGIGFRDLKY